MSAHDATGLDPETAERVGRNDARFRAANEGIERAAVAYQFEGKLVPFICECAAESCAEIVQLTLEEYEEVRANPRTFLNALGHDTNAQGAADVVFENDRYIIVEKKGRAAEVAEELDERN